MTPRRMNTHPPLSSKPCITYDYLNISPSKQTFSTHMLNPIPILSRTRRAPFLKFLRPLLVHPVIDQDIEPLDGIALGVKGV